MYGFVVGSLFALTFGITAGIAVGLPAGLITWATTPQATDRSIWTLRATASFGCGPSMRHGTL